MENPNYLSLVEASISELQSALTTGSITCVELVARLLRRISVYDCRGISLNSIPIINPDVFLEASASDERRVNGHLLGPLDGIPYTVKDSYKVKGMTVASGSPAFQDLIANEDAFTVQKLRAAGAVLIGRTNMPPMAAGGMQRGVYGRAESPYNLDYLAAAFASGSSNGSGVATAASFAAFGMGEETVSSGRSPASNNALIAYTPSRRAISIRGNWPLYPTCDVVVPHTRSMADMLLVLDHITARDDVIRGDFWRGFNQEPQEIEDPWEKQIEPLRSIAGSASLKGVRIAIPAEYIGGDQTSRVDPVYTSPSVVAIWNQARTDLERSGAIVTIVPSFVAVEKYEALSSTNDKDFTSTEPRLPENWHTTERSSLVAQAWEEFLNCNGAADISSLRNVQLDHINPAFPPDDPQVRFSEPSNRIHYDRLVSILQEHTPKTEDGNYKNLNIYTTRQLNHAIETLTKMRKMYFEAWLDKNNFDCVAFPAAGDVAAADADCNYASAEHAWRNGVKYSNGNRALRHLGIPSITVPMGMMEEKRMPIGLTFCGKAGDDISLLHWGTAYEAATRRRTVPPLTPPLDTDSIILLSDPTTVRSNPPHISSAPSQVRDKGDGNLLVNIRGTLHVDCIDLNEHPYTVDKRTGREIPIHEFPLIDIFVDGHKAPSDKIYGRVMADCRRDMFSHTFSCEVTIPKPPARSERDQVAAKRPIARDCIMVVMVARSEPEGRPAGVLEMIPLLDSDM